jgi:hypothetical protein
MLKLEQAPEQVWRCLLQVITAQEALLKRHATKPSDEWYTGRCNSPLKTPHAQNTNKTTLGILLHETKIDHLLPGRSSRVSSRWQCCFIHGITPVVGSGGSINTASTMRQWQHAQSLFLLVPNPSETCCRLRRNA